MAAIPVWLWPASSSFDATKELEEQARSALQAQRSSAPWNPSALSTARRPSCAAAAARRRASSSCDLFQQRLGLDQIGCVEPLGEPVKYRVPKIRAPRWPCPVATKAAPDLSPPAARGTSLRAWAIITLRVEPLRRREVGPGPARRQIASGAQDAADPQLLAAMRDDGLGLLFEVASALSKWRARRSLSASDTRKGPAITPASDL